MSFKFIKIFSIFLIISVLVIASLPFSVSADSLEEENYIVYTSDLSSIFGNGSIAYQRSTGDVDTYALNLSDSSNSYMWSPHFASNQISNGYTATDVTAQPTWVLSKDLFNGSKQYLFDFYIMVWAREDISYTDLKQFRFSFGTYNVKSFTPIEYIAHSNTVVGYVHFRFVIDGQILTNSINAVNFDFYDFNSAYRLTFGLPKYNDNRGKFIIREYTQADQIADIGSDISQPDFGSTNDSLGTIADDLKSFDEEYKIDMEQTSSDLESGMSTLNGTDMQQASIQVKNWIERFANENTVYTGFLIGGLTLAVCFWVIGRKGWEK